MDISETSWTYGELHEHMVNTGETHEDSKGVNIVLIFWSGKKKRKH